MNLHSASQLAAVDRPLVLRARPDVQCSEVCFSGQTAYVLKDPLTLEMFHLTAEEFFLFENMKQAVSLKRLQHAFQATFAPRQITPHDLQQGVNQLHGQGLLLSEAPGQGHELRERGDRRRWSERWQSWLKVLSFRLGSVDATRIVDGLHQRLRWLFSLPMLVIALAIVARALSILIGQGREVVARLPSLVELAQPGYWLLWIATIVVVKILHELAHAVTCKHFGGRCHEMGVLLLALIPCLYCDVTDVWRLSNKWQRIAVSAAGMIVELVIASLALILWWHVAPGLLQTWCLSAAIVCSVGTLLVNANPLLRYDGYYIFSDLVEVPNLASRAQGLLPSALRRWLLAESGCADPLLSARQRRGLLIYAVAARVYLTLVLLGIFVILMAWARPIRLENFVISLGVVTVAGMLFLPLAGVWRMLRNPSLRFRLRKPRIAGLTLALAALAATFFWWPITRSIRGPAVFVPAAGQVAYATTAGALQFALPAGSAVQAGDVLARLTNSRSELELARQQGEYEARQVRYEQLAAMRAWNDQIAAQLPTAEAAAKDALAQWGQLQTKAESLTIRALSAGIVVAPPAVTGGEPEQDCLPRWSGSPLEPRNLGCWIEPGSVLCGVADPNRLEALIAIDQADVAEVQPGQQVRILLDSSPVRVLTGEVIQVARRSAERTAVDEAVDAGKYHLVQVRLAAPSPPLLVGARGTAKIAAHTSTLWAIVANQLRQSLKLPW